MPDPTPTPAPGSERFTCSPEEAALDMDRDAAPRYEYPVRADWMEGWTDEAIARATYIPPANRDPSVPYLGPEID